MELIKLSEAYTLVDNTDKWMTSGNITKETSGAININFYSTLKEAKEGANRWGSVYYNVSAENNISANYNFEGNYREDFVDYSEELIAQILEQINPSELS